MRGARGGDDGRDAGDRRRVAAVRPAVHVDARARGARVDDDAVVAAGPVRREHDRKHDRGHDREQDSRRDNRRNDDVPARRTASRLLVGVHRRVLALLRKQRGLHVAVCHPSSNKKTHEKVVQSKRKGKKRSEKGGDCLSPSERTKLLHLLLEACHLVRSRRVRGWLRCGRLRCRRGGTLLDGAAHTQTGWHQPPGAEHNLCRSCRCWCCWCCGRSRRGRLGHRRLLLLLLLLCRRRRSNGTHSLWCWCTGSTRSTCGRLDEPLLVELGDAVDDAAVRVVELAGAVELLQTHELRAHGRGVGVLQRLHFACRLALPPVLLQLLLPLLLSVRLCRRETVALLASSHPKSHSVNHS